MKRMAFSKPSAIKIEGIIEGVSQVLLGKEESIKMSLACLLARGHLLIEDLPGQGKTTLAKAITQLTGLKGGRIQCTNDLLPSDIVGVSIFNRETREFDFHEGPLFREILLFDEINRASPKTQSAFLQAMEEGQVTVDSTTHALPSPFFVIATQNPTDHAGTFPLPSSQLDRFLMRIEIGYPDPKTEKEILQRPPPEEHLVKLEAITSKEEILEMQQEASQVFISDEILDQMVRMTQKSREMGVGISTRGAQALLRCARAWAYVEGRNFLIPEDLEAVSEAVLWHRLQVYSPENIRQLIFEICDESA